MVDVPKGSLFLGDKINPADHKRANDLVMYEAANLTTHGVIVGMTGSGKTGLGIVLLEECLLQGIPALIIDPKGDMGNLLLAFPDQKPESFRPYVLESDAKKEGRTLDEHAAVVAKQWADGQAAWDMTADRIRALHDAANFTIYTPGIEHGHCPQHRGRHAPARHGRR
jgi:DNA helicase HerA-like ATPase